MWQDELDELRHRQNLAKKMGGSEKVAKQHSKGRLTVESELIYYLTLIHFTKSERLLVKLDTTNKVR